MLEQKIRTADRRRLRVFRRIGRLLCSGLAAALLTAGAALAASPPLMVTPGQFSVSATGAGTYSIPIAAPPGTSGVAPSLSLNYSSQNGDGFVGLGWGLGGLSSITRCPRTLAQDSTHGSVNYDSGDRFCMDGQRLMLVNGASGHSYGDDGSEYRTEIESFTKVIAHGNSGTPTRTGPAWFEVHTKSGQIMEFGHTSDSQALVIAVVSGTPPSGTVREWMVNKISDVLTNYMAVTYSCEPISGGTCVSGEAYPTQIDYTGNASASKPPYNSVRFEYATRADSVPVYQAGGVVTPTVVLTHIKTYQGSSNLVQDYQLAYRAGTSTLHSHLISLTQCDNASHCLPATTFGWQGRTSTSFSSVSSTLPSPARAIPGDFNGDGLTDAAVLSGGCSASSYPVYLGQPSFGFSSSSYTLPMPSGISSWPLCGGYNILGTVLAPDGTSDILINVNAYKTSGPPPLAQSYMALLTTAGAVNLADYTSTGLQASIVSPGDFNGDGIVDFFVVGNPTSYAYLGNTSGGFTPDSGVGGLNPATAVIPAGDFDGDGCTDIYNIGTAPGSIIYAYNCHPAVSTVTPPSWAAFNGFKFGDFNGDGKTDLLYTSDTIAGELWLATGTGFVKSSWSIPIGWTIVGSGDWNGDGKADLLVQTSSGSDYELFLSTGNGFTPALDSMGNPVVITGSAGYSAAGGDWDNNGNSDFLLQFGSGSDSFVLIDYTPELMISVSNGVGAITTVAYDRINDAASPFYTKGSSSYPTQDMIGPQYVVREVDTSNGLGTCTPPTTTYCYSATYTYTGAKKDLQGRGFLGFSQVVATDPQTHIVTTTNYSTAFSTIGLVTTQTRVRTGNTHPLNTVTNTYSNNGGCGSGISPPTGVYQVCLTQSVISGYDLNDTAPLPTTTTNYTYDGYGDALTVNISVSYGGSTSSKNTTNTYCVTTTCIDNWFLGRLLTTSVNNIVGASNMTRQSSFAYGVTTGLLTVESIEPGVSTCNAGTDSCTLSTSYTYDAFGHRITTTVYGTGIPDRTSYAFYDSNGEFMTSAANALGQYEKWEYDPRFGTPTKHTGPNGLETNWVYDSFGRMTQETRPDGTMTKQSYAYCSGSCPTYGQFYTQSEAFASNGTTQIGPIGYAYFDMLSRGIANDAQGFDASNIRVATQYDANGRVQQTSRPYFTASASPAWTQFSYDDLGRVTQATFPDSSHTNYGFNGLTTTVTNNLSQTTTTVKNAQGLNASVTDATSHATSYIYDAYGDLLTVTDPVGNVITNTFDIRGNKVTSQDPDMGRWTYAYDVLAELTSQTDNKAQTTTLTYDVLGRPLTRTEAGLYSAWTYGVSAASHNVGQVVEAKACPTSGCTSIVSDKTYGFDGVGRESQYTLQTPTDYYGYATTYNSTNGQIASVRYPSGYTVNRTYNTTGFLTQLSDRGLAVWTINARDAELHITSQTAGNNVITTQAFNANTGLIQNQRAGGGSVASFDYAFDTIGNLTTRTDNSQPYTERFCYDSLNRLTNYNIGAACTGGNTAAYDTIGNITSKSGTGTYSYSGSRPHAVSSITGTFDGLVNPNYNYDGNGNLTCVSSGAGCSGTIGRTVNLTSFNMAASLSQNNNSLSLIYDDQHQRLQQTNTVSGTATTTTVYINDAASGVMSERVTAAGTGPSLWGSTAGTSPPRFKWGTDPWGGVTASALPTFTDYITVDGQVVAQRKITYPTANPWTITPPGCTSGSTGPCVAPKWNSFTWGPPGSLWGSAAGANPPRFKWGTDPWSVGVAVSWSYFNLDHLGSVAVITDQAGSVVQRLSFDPWGKQRNPNGTAVSCGTITSTTTTKGFTNQEQMPTQCLVNLNARLYDPSIGKFLAADTIVPDPYDGQSYNRYAYVNNNPLSFTDPSGHGCSADICITVTGFGFGGGGILGLSGGSGEGIGNADSPSNSGSANQSNTSTRHSSTPSSTKNQNAQITAIVNLPNLCSRAGGPGACSGSYVTGFWVKIYSSGEDSGANDDAQGNSGNSDTVPTGGATAGRAEEKCAESCGKSSLNAENCVGLCPIASKGPYGEGSSYRAPREGLLDPARLNAAPMTASEGRQVVDTLNDIKTGRNYEALNPHMYFNFPDLTTGAMLPFTFNGYTTFNIPGGHWTQRLVLPNNSEDNRAYYTDTHYKSFYLVTLPHR